jgi:hypothetical protein
MPWVGAFWAGRCDPLGVTDTEPPPDPELVVGAGVDEAGALVAGELLDAGDPVETGVTGGVVWVGGAEVLGAVDAVVVVVVRCRVVRVAVAVVGVCVVLAGLVARGVDVTGAWTGGLAALALPCVLFLPDPCEPASTGASATTIAATATTQSAMRARGGI